MGHFNIILELEFDKKKHILNYLVINVYLPSLDLPTEMVFILNNSTESTDIFLCHLEG